MKIANYVYIIECQGKLKIGKSQNPEQRLKELNTGNPNKLRLIHCEKFASQKASSEAEAMMHYYFEAEKIRGEWFKSNKKEAIEILNLLSQKRMGLVVGKKQIKDSLKKKQKRRRKKKSIENEKRNRDKPKKIYDRILKMNGEEILITRVEAKLLMNSNGYLNKKSVNYFNFENNFPINIYGKMVSSYVFLGLCEEKFKT